MNNDPAVGTNSANRHSDFGGNNTRQFTSAHAATLVCNFVEQIDSRSTNLAIAETNVMTDGNYILDSAEADALDLISGTTGVDVIDGGGSADKCRRWHDDTASVSE